MKKPTKPDYSDYLVHFTKPNKAGANPDTIRELPELNKMTARNRLLSILNLQTIYASSMYWKMGEAVCFTECPWTSLLTHASRYSKYGVGFSKGKIFAAGGGPVYYVRPDHFQKQQWDSHLKPFITPFWPQYRPEALDEKVPENMQKTIDFGHEREWRIPHRFEFEYENIEFVILPDYHSMAEFPADLKDAIGREKFLMIDQYKTIERIWPVHKF